MKLSTFGSMERYKDFWILVDCNNFYVSCQRVFEPKYNNVPCVVLSNNDGCVISRSDEAKAMGIKMGEPFFLSKNQFVADGVKVWSSNYQLYGDMSSRVMGTIALECPEVEVYSIDECFAKFTCVDDHYGDFNFKAFLENMKRKIEKWTGIPVCIGAGPTKALAKAANRIAKKYKARTEGIHIIDNEDMRLKAIKWLAVEDIWGIGRRHAARLQRQNIKTAYDFSRLHDDWVRKNMTVVGLRLLHDIQGKMTLDFEEVKPNKNIACTRSFKSGLTKYEDVSERLTAYVCHAAGKLRKQNDRCKELVVFVTTGGHTDTPYHRSFKIRTNFASNSSLELNNAAQYALKAIFKEGYIYKKCGVILSDFVPQEGEQLRMFNGRNVKHDSLMMVIDKLNIKYSKRVLKLAGEPVVKFDMRQDYLSPCYTTKIEDILVVRC